MDAIKAVGVLGALGLTTVVLRARESVRKSSCSPALPTPSKPTCLVTGGMGYIGSHTILQLVQAGYNCLVVDSLVNSSDKVLERMGEITGAPEAVTFVQGDVLDKAFLHGVFATHGPFQHVLHFAALKSVGESVAHPLKYYTNNVTGTLCLLEVMAAHACKSIVFSSSATVYGESPSPITEQATVGLGITNPYGQTKAMIETVLQDMTRAAVPEGEAPWRIALLRYFNPVGAHPSGLMGEDPNGPPNNLNPYILQVAVGRRPHLNVFGDDYDTVDGTGERDYLHVQDLGTGHLAAVRWLESQPAAPGDEPSCEAFNLGTGKAVSVLQAVAAVEAASGKTVPVVMQPRRAGDLASVFADPGRAERVLGWKAQHSFEQACIDGWRWQSRNPQGFGGPLLPAAAAAAGSV